MAHNHKVVGSNPTPATKKDFSETGRSFLFVRPYGVSLVLQRIIVLSSVRFTLIVFRIVVSHELVLLVDMAIIERRLARGAIVVHILVDIAQVRLNDVKRLDRYRTGFLGE